MSGIAPIEPPRVTFSAARFSAQSRDDHAPLTDESTPITAGLYKVAGNPRPELVEPARALTRVSTLPPASHARPPKPHYDGRAWTPQRAHAACKAFSDDAATRGVNTLLMGFEGLVSYDEDGTAQAYAWAIGDRREPPQAALASGYVLHGLVRPLVQRHGPRMEFLVFPHGAESGDPDGLPATCARIWQQHSPERRLVVAGHSMGGASASSLARTLAASDTRLDLMVTIDAVSTPRTPLQRWASTSRVFNFPRRIRLPGFGTIDKADLELRVPDWHTGVPGHPIVVDAVSRELGALIDPQQRTR